MQAADVPEILRIQAAAYAAAAFEPESAAVYLNRMALAPDLCWVVTNERGGLCGYLLSHPWHAGEPPALDTVLDALPQPATRWYVHDCAVDARSRGGGVAASLYEAAHDAAVRRGLRCAALVAIGQAATYWALRGYRSADAVHALDGYGDGACYMTRALDRCTAPAGEATAAIAASISRRPPFNRRLAKRRRSYAPGGSRSAGGRQ